MRPSTPVVRSSWAAAGLYLGLLLGGIGAFLAIRALGEGLTAPAAAEQDAALRGRQSVDVVFHVLATLAAVIALGRVLSVLFRLIGQPAVIGEVVAGIVLGPSVLGAVSPDWMHALIPSAEHDPGGLVMASLKTIAQLGVVLYMFLVGLEVNTTKFGRHVRSMLAVSHASIVVPFVLGAGLSLWLYPRLSPSGVPFTSFALFVGVALAITAFPVLARVLTDRGLERTDLGGMALSAAAVGDVTAWCVLAVVIGIVQAQLSSAVWVVVGSALFVGTMLTVVKPAARFIADWFEEHPENSVARPGLFVMILLAALATESIGIHAVFGAFLFGVVIPHESRLARELSLQLHAVVTVLLLPAFFAVAGMQTQIGLISGWHDWLICLAIIAVATIGKFGGTLLAARLTGLDWTTSCALGVLMNTRGLMELIVLNIGLSLGIISPALFTMMVLMALATTAATAPIFQALIPSAKEAEVAEVDLPGAAQA